MKKTLLSLLLAVSAVGNAQINTGTQQYTIPQLVSDVIIDNTLINVTNITSSSAINFGNINSLGYFENNGSDFPFIHGAILSTGNILNAPGPNSTSQSAGSWPGDASLYAISNDNGTGQFSDATSLEFDFVAPTNQMILNFIFASEEYGFYQCNYGDAFAIFLTEVSTGTTINLGTLPNTIIPISVTTVRDSQYNSNCPSANAPYFDTLYTTTDTSAPINFNGVTVPITTQAELIPGATYHIKFVIADRNDSSYDSALFIDTIDFALAQFNIGVPYDLMVCDDNNDNVAMFNLTSNNAVILDGLNPAEYTVTYHETHEDAELNVSPIINPTTYSNIAAMTTGGEQVLYARVTKNGPQNLYAFTSFSIIVMPKPYAGIVDEVVVIDNDTNGMDGITMVNLTSIESEVLAGGSPDDVGISYHTTLMSAEAGAPAIIHPETYTTQSATLYVRLENVESGCYTVRSFEVVVLSSDYETPRPIGETEQDFTPGETLADLEVEGENVQWYAIQNPLAGRSGNTTNDDDTPLPMSTLLVDNTTYYASQTVHGIESLERLPVTVHAALNTAEHAFAGFSYSPNPVKDVLTITNSKNIEEVTIYNLLGQSVYQKVHNTDKALVDVSLFTDGVYIVKIVSSGNQYINQIVKQ